MRLDLVDVLLPLIAFSHRLEILPCVNVNVDGEFQQTILLTEKTHRYVCLSKREDESIALTNICNPQLFICVCHNSHGSQNLGNDDNLI